MDHYPEAYRAYLIEFHATRDYFECHELLEEYWKALPPAEPDRDVWMGLIQIAVASYHHRRGNRSGARKMFGQAAVRMKRDALDRLGLDGEALLRIVGERLKELDACPESAPYREFDLPIADHALLISCMEASERKGFEWGTPSPMGDRGLIDRHTLRDRSDVIKAREAAVSKKKMT
ncbi:hypothetical protein BG53_14050 [Paenibacillus darwinianus]|uniref:DUF309 domain-containing protein n=1 Tax=Paenibacillus darwinianus TaxID=1380763 RepID=A0A9W5W7M3_9BACL|nr:DUF309 domain-containing protein [Paenibacillus darwinianus]EXX89783.1 hypothetical protein BG52_14815 [Paenibacillus darwinianus]EXX90147.1 hypothetical protein BG53_14050 [Paenibacillus darwinianus]EXX90513.1 hypothetical protein CH50_15170 [Paenibacillus darwinianus]